MSYDVNIEYEGCCAEHWHNHTSNTAGILAEAGLNIRDINGLYAQIAGEIVTHTADKIAENKEHYRALEPANGWGTVESTIGFLRAIARECEIHPKGTVRVSC